MILVTPQSTVGRLPLVAHLVIAP